MNQFIRLWLVKVILSLIQYGSNSTVIKGGTRKIFSSSESLWSVYEISEYLRRNKTPPEENGRGRIAAHFTAGLIAGIVSRTATAPLDRLKIISQVTGKNMAPLGGIKMMIHEGGFWSMWRGNGTNVLKVGPEISSKFLAYNEIKNFLMSNEKSKEATTGQRLVAGFSAGALSHSLIHPLEVCRTRLTIRKTGEESKLWKIAKVGYKKSGWRFFFKGYPISILGISLFTCIDFTTYEKLKGTLWTHSAAGIVIGGMCSSLVAILTCFPIGVVGVYLAATDEKLKFRDVKSFILRRGFSGMYSGLTSALVKGLPMFALSYVTYEFVLNFLGHEMA